MNSNVRVENNLIAAVGPAITLPEGAEVIDGGGRTLMPGLIDMHTHLALYRSINEVETTWDGFTLGAIASESMRKYLDRGDPTRNVSILLDHDNNISFVMKDGVVYKNSGD